MMKLKKKLKITNLQQKKKIKQMFVQQKKKMNNQQIITILKKIKTKKKI